MHGQIIDKNNAVVVEWDTQEKTCVFNNKTLERQAELGIEILPFMQSEYEGHSKVSLPKDATVSQTDFDLFIKAFTDYYFKKELQKNGFRKLENGIPFNPQKV